MKTKYIGKGLVYGNYWGGGKGCYSSNVLYADTKEAIIEQTQADIEDGSLDGGMGYESLIAAILTITKLRTTIIDGDEFTNTSSETVIVGDVTEEEKKFLNECLENL